MSFADTDLEKLKWFTESLYSPVIMLCNEWGAHGNPFSPVLTAVKQVVP